MFSYQNKCARWRRSSGYRHSHKRIREGSTSNLNTSRFFAESMYAMRICYHNKTKYSSICKDVTLEEFLDVLQDLQTFEAELEAEGFCRVVQN